MVSFVDARRFPSCVATCHRASLILHLFLRSVPSLSLYLFSSVRNQFFLDLFYVYEFFGSPLSLPSSGISSAEIVKAMMRDISESPSPLANVIFFHLLISPPASRNPRWLRPLGEDSLSIDLLNGSPPPLGRLP